MAPWSPPAGDTADEPGPLVSALLTRRMVSLSALARAYAPPTGRRVARPTHDLLQRRTPQWRVVPNPPLDTQAVVREWRSGGTVIDSQHAAWVSCE